MPVFCRGVLSVLKRVTLLRPLAGYILYDHKTNKYQGLDPLIRSVSTVTAARANASSVSPVLCLEILSWVGCPQDG